MGPRGGYVHLPWTRWEWALRLTPGCSGAVPTRKP